MEADARTTRGIIGEAESRTSAGWIFRLISAVTFHRRVSWYVLNSEYDVVKTFDMSWHITERVSKTFNMSWHVTNRITKTFNMSWDVWNWIKKTFDMSWDVQRFVTKTFDISWNIYDNLSGKVKYAFKSAKTITEFFGDRKNSGDKKKSRMR